MSNLSIGLGTQGEEGRPSSMTRVEDVVGRPIHTMTKAVQQRVGFPTQIVYIDDVYSPVEGTQDQPFIETQSQARAIGKPSLVNQGQSLTTIPYELF